VVETEEHRNETIEIRLSIVLDHALLVLRFALQPAPQKRAEGILWAECCICRDYYIYMSNDWLVCIARISKIEPAINGK
jgi:hypothetical protein